MEKRYAVIGEDGCAAAFYSDRVHKDIPAGAVPIDEADWRDYIAHQGRRKLRLADGRAQSIVVEPPAPEPPHQVSKLRLVRSLRTAGLWDPVKQALANGPENIRDDWEAASVLRRDDPIIGGLLTILTEAELDAAWTAAGAAP